MSITSSRSRPCPSCKTALQVHTLPALYGGQVEIDFCFSCQGIWFDQMENMKLSPEAVGTVFKALHEHRDTPRTPLASRLSCPECRGTLVQGFDIVRSGRYITHRCASRHGRFSGFSSFMIEKGFVRQLTKTEIADIARKVGSIHCSACGAPVDLRKEDACSHCRTALSLLDPQAVEKALQAYAQSPSRQNWGSPPDVAEALVALEKERSQQRREQTTATLAAPGAGLLGVDLLSVGLRLLGSLLTR